MNSIESFIYSKLSQCGSVTSSAPLNENFANPEDKTKTLVVTLLAILIAQLILVVIVRWLWNTFLTQAVTVVRPVEDIWTMLGVTVLVRLLFR